MPAVGETIVVRGRATGSAPLLWWSRLTIGEKTQTLHHAASFTVETADGAIEIRPPTNVEENVAPAKTRRCTWDDLDEITRERHASIAPGPGETCELRSLEIRAGDEVIVSGKVTATGPKSERGYRDQEMRVTALDAATIGVGANAEDVIAEAAPKPPSKPLPWWSIVTIVTRVLLTLPLVVLAIRTAIGYAPARAELVWPGVLAYFTLGVFVTSYRRMLISAEDEVTSQFNVATFMPFFATAMVGLVPVVSAFGDGPGKKANSGIVWVLLGTSLVLIGLATWSLRQAIRFRDFFVARAGWNVIEGTARTLLDRTSRTVDIEVEGKARTVVLEGVLRATEDHDTSTFGSGRSATTYYHHKISIGGRVLVAGRFESEPVIQIRGPSSVVLFGCAADRFPRACLDAHVRQLGLVIVQSVIATILMIVSLLLG